MATSDELSVGRLAEATGLTVRTLHYYEEIGLLTASERTQAGHRRYTNADVERLYRICLLRRLELPLSDVADALDDPEWALRSAVGRHASALERRLQGEDRLLRRLRALLTALERLETKTTDDLLEILEDMTMLDTNVQRRISILVYRDIETAHSHLVGVFGLGPGDITRDEHGHVLHAEVEAGDGVIWMHPESDEYRLSSPTTLGRSTGCVSVLVGDVDAHHEYARQHGADIVYDPVDQPYGYREYSARDIEGHLWSFMKALD